MSTPTGPNGDEPFSTVKKLGKVIQDAAKRLSILGTPSDENVSAKQSVYYEVASFSKMVETYVQEVQLNSNPAAIRPLPNEALGNTSKLLESNPGLNPHIASVSNLQPAAPSVMEESSKSNLNTLNSSDSELHKSALSMLERFFNSTLSSTDQSITELQGEVAFLLDQYEEYKLDACGKKSGITDSSGPTYSKKLIPKSYSVIVPNLPTLYFHTKRRRQTIDSIALKLHSSIPGFEVVSVSRLDPEYARAKWLCTLLVKFSRLEHANAAIRDDLVIGERSFVCEYFEDKYRLQHCLRCRQYGHLVDQCQSDKDTCPKCAGEHKHMYCQSKITKCAACRQSHFVWDNECEVRQRAIARVNKLREDRPEYHPDSVTTPPIQEKRISKSISGEILSGGHQDPNAKLNESDGKAGPEWQERQGVGIPSAPSAAEASIPGNGVSNGNIRDLRQERPNQTKRRKAQRESIERASRSSPERRSAPIIYGRTYTPAHTTKSGPTPPPASAHGRLTPRNHSSGDEDESTPKARPKAKYKQYSPRKNAFVDHFSSRSKSSSPSSSDKDSTDDTTPPSRTGSRRRRVSPGKKTPLDQTSWRSEALLENRTMGQSPLQQGRPKSGPSGSRSNLSKEPGWEEAKDPSDPFSQPPALPEAPAKNVETWLMDQMTLQHEKPTSEQGLTSSTQPGWRAITGSEDRLPRPPGLPIRSAARYDGAFELLPQIRSISSPNPALSSNLRASPKPGSLNPSLPSMSPFNTGPATQQIRSISSPTPVVPPISSQSFNTSPQNPAPSTALVLYTAPPGLPSTAPPLAATPSNTGLWNLLSSNHPQSTPTTSTPHPSHPDPVRPIRQPQNPPLNSTWGRSDPLSQAWGHASSVEYPAVSQARWGRGSAEEVGLRAMERWRGVDEEEVAFFDE